VLNWRTWLAFWGEAAVMLYLDDDRHRWLRDHTLDVAAVLL
jgi:hypothetical protein